MTCLYTWTDKVDHQCERTGEHSHHICPCGAQTIAACLCAVVKVGGQPTGSRSWNPDCPVHPWTEAMQAQADRAVALQRQAAAARRAARDG